MSLQQFVGISIVTLKKGVSVFQTFLKGNLL